MFTADELDEIRSAKERWEEEQLDPVLERFGERKETFETDTGGQDVQRLYTPADRGEVEYQEELGFPGEEPYTRGVYPTGYRGRLWTMRQYAGMGTAEETNERFHYLLDEGQTGLSMAFDLPTQMGYDSDDSMATGEVGKAGVAIDSLRDMETVFDGIPLDEVDQYDHQRARVRPACDVYRRRRPTGCRPRRAPRNHSERYSERVYRPKHLYFPARALDAHHHGYL